MPLLPKIVKGIGAGIGLATEAIADHKEKKSQRSGRSPSPNPEAPRHMPSPKEQEALETGQDSSDSDLEDLHNDEADWILDEAAHELDDLPNYNEIEKTPIVPVEEVTRSFVESHNLTTTIQTYQPLPYPVILPQRRPKAATRGFVRAYAPILGDCSGIDQQMFLDFLQDFDRASRASPVFNVINIAAFAVGFIPNPIAMATATAVQVAAGVAEEIQTRYRRNTYLDQINDRLFKPRGLYVMIMTYKPDNPYQPFLNMDVRPTDTALAKTLPTPDSQLKQTLKNIRLTSGVTKGEMSLPESAPLIYPSLDAAASASAQAGTAVDATGRPIPPKKESMLQSSTAFVNSYLDRRAQAAYAGTNPGSRLAAPPPEKKFASRYSDPNHPANSGSISALLTGGAIDLSAGRRMRKAQRRAAWHGVHLSDTDLRNAAMARGPRYRTGLIARALHKDVLYLTIVNLPTESEMREMQQELAKYKNA